MENHSTNPYVGPHSIKTGQPFFGRDREIRSLSSLLIAERIVLLHSPSGAGKSSLVQAGLIPRLSSEFGIYPLVRVNLDLPKELQGREGVNRYVVSTLISLEEDQPPEKRLPLSQLAGLSIDSYLNQRPLPNKDLENSLLLFDQFEESLTLSPTDIPAKREFFDQLGQMLRNHQRWALFSIREDYMGGLAPYLRFIPNRFNVAFRLGLLGVDAARQAIQMPAKNEKVNFTFDAAEKLVQDLSRVLVQQQDGNYQNEQGPDVEPVQLQVVCFNLWRSPAVDDDMIDLPDVEKYGNVDDALSKFYNGIVTDVAAKTSMEERVLRRWFDNKLITKDGIRSQVLKGVEDAEGLPISALSMLEDAHIVRGETRGGKTWFELSHDRLVKPVRESNAVWFESNLTLVQRQSEYWDQQGRGEGLLLRGSDLSKAEAESKTSVMTPVEQAYLEASRNLHKRIQREKLLNRAIRLFAVAATIAVIVAIVFYFQANNERDKAQQSAYAAQTAEGKAVNNFNLASTAQANAETEKQNAVKQANIARSGELAAQSQNDSDNYPVRGLLLSLESMNINSGESSQQEQALRSALQNVGGTPLNPDLVIIYDLAYDPSGKWVAASGSNGTFLWTVGDSGMQPVGALPHAGQYSYNILAVSSDGGWLAAGADDNSEIWLWRMNGGKPENVSVPDNNMKATSLAVSPDGHWLAASDGEKLHLWNLGSGTPQTVELPDKFSVSGFVFSNGGTKIAVYGDDGFGLWQLNPDGVSNIYRADAGKTIYTINFSAHDDYLVLNGYDGLELHYIRPVTPYQASLPDQPKYPDSFAVSLDTNDRDLLATSDEKGTRLWDLASSESVSLPLPEGYTRPDELIFSPDNRWLLAFKEGAIWVWDFSAATLKATLLSPAEAYNISFDPSGKYLYTTNLATDVVSLWKLDELNARPQKLVGHENSISTRVFSPDGTTLITGANDGMLRVWNLSAPMNEPLVSKAYGSEIDTIQISRDGKWIATGEKGGLVRLWSATDPSISPLILAPQSLRDKINNVNFSADDHWLSAGTWYGVTYLWDMTSAGIENGSIKAPSEINIEDNSSYYSMNLIPDPNSKWLAGSGQENRVLLWKMGDMQAQPMSLEGADYGKGAPVFSRDGRWLATSEYRGGKISLWDLNSPNSAAAELPEHEGTVNSMDFSQDGKWLASGSQDGSLDLYSLVYKNNKNLGKIGTINKLKFSPAGNFLAVGLYTGEINLWNVKAADFPSENPTRYLTANPAGIADIEFSPDDHWMASMGLEGNVLIWDTTNFDAGAITIKNKEINAISFSADNKSLVTGSKDGTIRVWSLDFDRLKSLACNLAGRNLTQTEWEQYFPAQDYHQTCTQWPKGP